MDFKVWGVCNALIMCWSFTALCLWWKESGKLICYLWRYEYKLFRDGCSEMIFKAKKKKKIVCVCALRLRKPTVSHRRDKHWWLVCVSSSFFFFFCHIARKSYRGRKKREDHFVGSESLSVMAVVIFVTWLPLLFANCKPPFMSTVWIEP